MSDSVVVPSDRDVRGTLDAAEGSDAADACVVACPPHPQMGGDSTNPQLLAVSDAAVDAGLDCLRFDYGAWDDGEGEVRDVLAALDWARERYDDVGLFGYSFGASVGLRAVAAASEQPTAVSALAPVAEVADAVDGVDAPLQVLVCERDETVDSEPVAERARERGFDVVTVPGDHFLAGQHDDVAETVVTFLAGYLAP